MTCQTHPSQFAVETSEIVVCIPTFRRPAQLAATLDSLVAQDLARPFSVVVAENDASGREGLAIAEAYFAAGRLSGLCVVEQRQGNCHAINAAFGTALSRFPQARFFLMIDDDETAAPHWLSRMVETAEQSGAGIVGGPVHPRLEPGSPQGLAAHPAFIPFYEKSGPVPVIYGSGNCLITRETFARLGAPHFDTDYNYLGGGDFDFFIRARRAGTRFHWVAEASIVETVPLERTRALWLARRGLRIGAINHRVEVKHARGLAGYLKVAARSAALLALSPFRGARLFARTREPLIGLHPVIVAVGRCLAAVGIEPHQYRAGGSK